MIEKFDPPTVHVPDGYSHVTISRAGRLAHLAGQCPVDLSDEVVGEPGDYAAQTEQVITNCLAAPGGRSERVMGAGIAVAVTGAVFAAIGGLIGFPGPSPGLTVTTVSAAIVMTGGVALGALIRSIASTPVSLGRWTRRSAAGGLLLTPTALLATQPFLADGWSFANCGTLVDRYRSAGSELTEFRLACDAATQDRVLQAAILAAAGCLAAVGYGLWLRRRARRLRDNAASSEELN